MSVLTFIDHVNNCELLREEPVVIESLQM